MEMIARLIRVALDACFQRGAIDWHPDEEMPESFIAECEIEFNGYDIGDCEGGDFYVLLNNVLCFVGLEDAFDVNCTWWHCEVIGDA